MVLASYPNLSDIWCSCPYGVEAKDGRRGDSTFNDIKATSVTIITFHSSFSHPAFHMYIRKQKQL